MTAEILCVGTELLLGNIVNTNATFLAKELSNLGIFTYYHTVVGDNPQRLMEVLKTALSRSDIVVMTGGLGPTYDDLTKETVAKYFELCLKLCEPALKRMECLFKSMHRQMSENNKKQAMMPEGATVLENENGTAPGLIIEKDSKTVIMMPGPPREMKPMFINKALPYLSKKSDIILVSKNINFFGIGESALAELLNDIMVNAKNPTVAPYAKDGEVEIRVTASAKDKDSALKMIAPVIDEIKKRAGRYIYGIDVFTLQNALVAVLKEKRLKIAVAESCTGGLLSKRITEIPGSSKVFDFSACTYSNEMKIKILGVKKETIEKYGAVSDKTVTEMSKGIRKISGADIGLSVTGIAGPSGGTGKRPVGLVYIAVESDVSSEVKEFRLSRGYGDERELIRYLASSNALYMALKTAEKF